ncbi:hypothetical protein EDB92DRAFT_1932912 [Lactarius akahatsu]|uniref:Uncharacterized protein n=1 Tax=Lactarius akahatsu TaxID=416441 RepID=A0AAD4QBJ8_9AGAM|nr:hypothetical protein EDB92DRAFT_1932912 [Lactarius akahatsu]
MASTDAAVASSSTTTLTEESGPQAGPLPSKRGEIGFIEGVHTQPLAPAQPVDQDTLPARHPADRLPLPSSSGLPNDAPLPPRTLSIPSDSSSMNIVDKRSFRWHKKLPKFMGIHFMTLLLICVQTFLFAGTIVGWVFAARALGGTPLSPPSDPDGGQNPPPTPADHSSNIFVHVAFARRIFRLRAERYAFKHPGEVLPNATIPMAPWSRPPLPTYAAALAASGVGTGDVEDAEIARAPPPAYGKTRGSTLVLAGFLRNSLLVQAREHEEDRSESRMIIGMRDGRSADPRIWNEELTRVALPGRTGVNEDDSRMVSL